MLRKIRITAAAVFFTVITLLLLDFTGTLHIIGLVWTALYISFTEAGIEEILGTQARYYYPFIFMFYLCFQTDKIKNTIELGKYQMIIMLASNFIIFQQMWEVLLVRKCL